MEEQPSKLIAHVRQLPDGSWAEPHGLKDHLEGTAAKTAQFAEIFHSGNWGRALGLSHDLGKSSHKWQAYLCRKSGFDNQEGKTEMIEHSAPGAKLAETFFGKMVGRILAYCIAGHHAGLPDWLPGESSSTSALSFRLSKAVCAELPSELMAQVNAAKPDRPPWQFTADSLDMSLWTRMLFSCLVDADFLDTESYMQPEKANQRSRYLPLASLLERFNLFLEQFIEQKKAQAEKSLVNTVRQSILADCRLAATKDRGLFSLTVPTGGGKTLSSLAFALGHAAKHGMGRIIYVIPYTSIIEQNADVFRKAVGTEQVVEHHSSLDEDDSSPQARLAAENWDAPLIVTTSVQFFESLFASKTSRCRKLHNIANSVVILDEAQLIPVEFVSPILQTMDLLVEHYGVTLVISTATQPALESREGFNGLKHKVAEIVSDVPRLYRELKRVKVETPNDWQTTTSWDEIALELKQYEQVLCVVSDRRSCRELHLLMPPGTIHLSALMCGQHRSKVISQIKDKLKNGEAVSVISTQLVEAGIDLDFPVVYRALAGLDSIAQAAGRCNREGRMAGGGRVVVFRPPRKAPVGILRKAAETTEIMLKTGLEDPLEHAHFERFFRELYWKANSLDGKGILSLLKPDQQECGMQFRTAAERFSIIDDKAQHAVLVPYGYRGKELIGLLKSKGPERWLLRKLQRYTVNVYTGDFAVLERNGAIECVSGEKGRGIYAINNDVDYDPLLGLLVNDGPYDLGIFIN